MFRHSPLIIILLVFSMATNGQRTTIDADKNYRPKIHFTPPFGWMNDPNGMIYKDSIYHLFYQHNPDSTVWGPMHWGHATSKDLFTWEDRPIALYPDSIGTIFSGSAVYDKNNTSGLGKNGKGPLIAIYTQHNHNTEHTRFDFQTQSLAYSNDEGKTWEKYAKNPVISNPGKKDFRDPKVFWHEKTKMWVMSLAVFDHIEFYTSSNLKAWKKSGEFGKGLQSNKGVWECPDLISFKEDGKEIWVLIVNTNPGGPNSGSGTFYYVGDFDGKTFKAKYTDTRWLDYGPDNYAGVTYSNVENRKLFLGWMSNWNYANSVPTTTWRSSMTLPRELFLTKVNEKHYLSSKPARELENLLLEPIKFNDGRNEEGSVKALKQQSIFPPCKIDIEFDIMKSFSLDISNDLGEVIVFGYDHVKKTYYINRSNSGKVAFKEGFGNSYLARRIENKMEGNISIVLDMTSLEVFADNGLQSMTAIFFPTKPYNSIQLKPAKETKTKSFVITPIKINNKSN